MSGEEASRSLNDAARAYELAIEELKAFDSANSGVWFRSKDRLHNEHVGNVARARLEWIRARHDAERAAEAGLGEPLPSADPPTANARMKIAELPGTIAELRRNGRLSKLGLATALGIDRKTLDDWIKRGWVVYPPA
jgi:hypothetical protein